MSNTTASNPTASNPPNERTLWRFQWVKVHGGGRSLWYERYGSGYRLFIVSGRKTKVDLDNWLRIANSTYDRHRRPRRR